MKKLLAIIIICIFLIPFGCAVAQPVDPAAQGGQPAAPASQPADNPHDQYTPQMDANR